MDCMVPMLAVFKLAHDVLVKVISEGERPCCVLFWCIKHRKKNELKVITHPPFYRLWEFRECLVARE